MFIFPDVFCEFFIYLRKRNFVRPRISPQGDIFGYPLDWDLIEEIRYLFVPYKLKVCHCLFYVPRIGLGPKESVLRSDPPCRTPFLTTPCTRFVLRTVPVRLSVFRTTSRHGAVLLYIRKISEMRKMNSAGGIWLLTVTNCNVGTNVIVQHALCLIRSTLSTLLTRSSRFW